MNESGISVLRTGQIAYADAAAAQAAIAGARRDGDVPDVLLLLEHPPVYTKGRRSDPAELPMGEQWYEMQGIEVCETDRGGRVTYHGPGQLVGYPIIDLTALGGDVHAYVRRLEQVMIESLAAYDVKAQIIEGLTGVWTGGAPPVTPGEIGPQGTPVGQSSVNRGDSSAGGPGASPPGPATAAAGRVPPGQDPPPSASEARKIGAIGVHVSRGVSTHGFAVNVNNDLQPFEWIVPCGIEAARATSLTRELGAEQDLGRFAALVTDRFAAVFEREITPIDPAELAERVSGASPLAAAEPARR